MLTKENFSLDHISELREVTKRDPILLERCVYAFGLLESITRVDMPFIFKGGTSLMLLLEHPMRLSTDIDIIVKPGTDVEEYIKKASTIFPFIRYEEQSRFGKNNIEKRHFKFIYDSPYNKRELYILLDVVFEESHYASTIQRRISNELLLTAEPYAYVSIPSINCILGDKLTAFAPHTTGIPFGINKDMEIMKQLYDISTLAEAVNDYEEVIDTYYQVAKAEIDYRGEPITPEDALKDTIAALTCIISKGKQDADEYKLYVKAIRDLSSHIISERYSGELAAERACRVMYVAACVLTKQRHPIAVTSPEEYIKADLPNEDYRKLTYMRKQNIEAYAYLVEAVRMLGGEME